jgi:hypothetical protein
VALSDVDELYFRPRTRRVFRTTREEGVRHKRAHTSMLYTDAGCVPPTLLYTPVDKHYTRSRESLRRHVPQMLLRGEQIVAITSA